MIKRILIQGGKSSGKSTLAELIMLARGGVTKHQGSDLSENFRSKQAAIQEVEAGKSVIIENPDQKTLNELEKVFENSLAMGPVLVIYITKESDLIVRDDCYKITAETTGNGSKYIVDGALSVRRMMQENEP